MKFIWLFLLAVSPLFGKEFPAGLKSGDTVVLDKGTYFLTEALSMKSLQGVTIKGSPSGEVIISGGREIKGWKKIDANIWQAKIDKGWFFRELFAEGDALQRARHPNSGNFRIAKGGPDDRTSFFFKEGNVKKWSNPHLIEFVFYHEWSISRVNFQSIDYNEKQVFLRDPVGQTNLAHYAISKYEKDPRYYLENHPQFLDSPGEWYLDVKSQTLSYFAHKGEDPNKKKFVAPALDSILNIEACSNVSFENISFQHCSYLLPPGGLAGAQSAFHQRRPAVGEYKKGRDSKPAAIRVSNSENVSFKNCVLGNLGATGLSVVGSSRNTDIKKCHFYNIGGNGLMIGSSASNKKILVKNTRITNNLIENCGTLDFGAVGIWIGITAETLVSGNELRHLPYTGISMGWRWNPSPTESRDNVIEKNYIHHVMQKLSDGGGIYTLGRHANSSIRDNIIHDIPLNVGRAQSNGIFLDQGSSDITVEKNTIYKIAKSPIRFNKSGRVSVKRNILYRGSDDIAYVGFNSKETKEKITVLDNDLRNEAGPDNLKK